MNAVRRTVVRWLATLAASALLLAQGAQAAPPQDGPKPGEEFLRLVDAKQYAESWGVASDFFKQSVSQKDWVAQVRAAREPLGNVVARSAKGSELQKDPRGAPPGDYLLLTYETKFAASDALWTETLPLIKSADGQWRAVGYFVR